MEIIFDSEEQKKNFIDDVLATAAFCPSHVGLQNCASDKCGSCWEKCGIEMTIECVEV